MTETKIRSRAPTASRRAARPSSLDLCDNGISPCRDSEKADRRFESLLTAAEWASLPAVVRHRFSRPLAPGTTRIYVGDVTLTELSPAGRMLAGLARLAGGPLPSAHGATGPAIVTVREDAAAGGQVWSRSYARPGRMPQSIHSVKRFGGPTGLEEYLGRGLAMRLTLHAIEGALVFRSAGYAISVLGRQIALPGWLSPGTCEIRHRDEGSDRFSFTLTLSHPRLGRLVHQVAYFKEIR